MSWWHFLYVFIFVGGTVLLVLRKGKRKSVFNRDKENFVKRAVAAIYGGIAISLILLVCLLMDARLTLAILLAIVGFVIGVCLLWQILKGAIWGMKKASDGITQGFTWVSTKASQGHQRLVHALGEVYDEHGKNRN